MPKWRYKKIFKSLKLDISPDKLNKNIEKIRESIQEYSYYKYNFVEIILYSAVDKKEREEEKLYSLYKIFEENKNYTILDKYLFVKVLLISIKKYKYGLSQINDIFYQKNTNEYYF